MSFSHSRTFKKIFIGSSVEGLPVAEALRSHFEHEARWRAYLWSHVQFYLSQATLASLQQFLEEYDYGVFVLTPDDEVEKRGKTLRAPRDNVLFELGLFLGHAGGRRTFIVCPRHPEIHVPTDLGGITAARYQPADDTQELTNNLFDAARQIRINIERYEAERRSAARDRLNVGIVDVQEELQQATSDRRRLQIVLDGFGVLLRAKAEAMDQSVRDALEDILLFTHSLMDVLDPDQLAVTQSTDLTEVWVYAPQPLELADENKKLRVQVAENILAGVRYVYFVDGDHGVRCIRGLIDAMAAELPEGQAKRQKLVEGVTVVVLQPEEFMTYYTIHRGPNGRVIVLQSVIRKNRRDFLTTLDEDHAKRVAEIVEQKLGRTVEQLEEGLRVRRVSAR